MPKFQVIEEDIIPELRRILNLDDNADVGKAIRHADVNFKDRGIHISFNFTNIYLVGYVLTNSRLVQTIGAQSYPNLSGCCLNIVEGELAKVLGYNYDPLLILDLRKIRFDFVAALLNSYSLSRKI